MSGRRVLITGGAGFIGCNLVNHFIQHGDEVVIYDNLYRKGVKHNILWLRGQYGDSFKMIKGDVRDYDTLLRSVEGAQLIIHTAGQTAVTTSVADPRQDFEINAAGTLNVLEAARFVGEDPIFIYLSSNKVYGGMENVKVIEKESRYEYLTLEHGIDECQPLDFYSPYGCSKGTGDQYVHDYARIYKLRSLVFRMSSIYGPRQFGMEDQAWVAYFVIAAVKGWPISIYGDGKQVRDILFVEDLVQAVELACSNIQTTSGQIYNIGGGPTNTISIWREFEPLLRALIGNPIPMLGYNEWRPGDQRVYISDIRKAMRDFGWKPTVRVAEGLERIYLWVVENQDLFER